MVWSILRGIMDREARMRKFCAEHCTGFCYIARGLTQEIALKDDQDHDLFPDEIPATTPRLEAITGSAQRFLEVCARRPELEATISPAEQHIPPPENRFIDPSIGPDEPFF